MTDEPIISAADEPVPDCVFVDSLPIVADVVPVREQVAASYRIGEQEVFKENDKAFVRRLDQILAEKKGKPSEGSSAPLLAANMVMENGIPPATDWPIRFTKGPLETKKTVYHFADPFVAPHPLHYETIEVSDKVVARIAQDRRNPPPVYFDDEPTIEEVEQFKKAMEKLGNRWPPMSFIGTPKTHQESWLARKWHESVLLRQTYHLLSHTFPQTAELPTGRRHLEQLAEHLCSIIEANRQGGFQEGLMLNLCNTDLSQLSVAQLSLLQQLTSAALITARTREEKNGKVHQSQHDHSSPGIHQDR